MGVISKPGGRFGPPETDKPGSETKARSGSAYQSGVKAGFSISGGSSIDAVPVKPKSPVMVGREGVPNTELGEKAVN